MYVWVVRWRRCVCPTSGLVTHRPVAVYVCADEEFRAACALLNPVDLLRVYHMSEPLFELAPASSTSLCRARLVPRGLSPHVHRVLSAVMAVLVMADLRAALGNMQPRPDVHPAAGNKTATGGGKPLRMALGGISAALAQTACQPIETIKVCHLSVCFAWLLLLLLLLLLFCFVVSFLPCATLLCFPLSDPCCGSSLFLCS